jgi:DtxR family transcriptional regulator, manganese transport regulator
LPADFGERMAKGEPPKHDVSRLEDYLEAIYNLDHEKGYASTADISDRLGVKPPTVSSMVVKLARSGYLEYQRYRGMKLTQAGEKVAKSVIRRHQVISEFISMIGVDEQTAFVDTEGIEHHVHPTTIRRLERLAEYLRENPQTLKAIRDFVEGK